MRKALAALLLLAAPTWAGDDLLGVILVTDGGSSNNATTGYGAAGCASQTSPQGAGACAQAFPIGAPALLSIQCKDQGAYVVVGRVTTDAGEGVKLAVDQFFSTSAGAARVRVGPLRFTDGGLKTYGGMPDGGTYVGGVVAIAPLNGNARAECNVSRRAGNE